MNIQKIQFSLESRASLALLSGILGLIWQAVILSFGGQPSRELIGASVTIIVASLGIGIKKEPRYEDGSSNSKSDRARLDNEVEGFDGN